MIPKMLMDELKEVRADRDRLAGELAVVRGQLEKLINIIAAIEFDACPSFYDLYENCDHEKGCADCWRQALQAGGGGC